MTAMSICLNLSGRFLRMDLYPVTVAGDKTLLFASIYLPAASSNVNGSCVLFILFCRSSNASFFDGLNGIVRRCRMPFLVSLIRYDPDFSFSMVIFSLLCLLRICKYS